MNRQMILDLDPDDYDAVQEAMARRQAFGRDMEGGEAGLYPDGESNAAGMVLAEICRGWLEMLDAGRGQPAPPRPSRRTCSWCHTDNALAPSGPTYCAHCQHRADVPRLGCDCAKCRPQA